MMKNQKVQENTFIPFAKSKYQTPLNVSDMKNIMSISTLLQPSCATLTPTPSPLPSEHPACHSRGEPVLRRTRITLIRRIFADFSTRMNPCHPCNPCSTAALFFADAPEIRDASYIKLVQITNLRSSAFICGSFPAEVQQINRHLFINNRCSKYSSAPGIHIGFSCALPEPEPSPLPSKHPTKRRCSEPVLCRYKDQLITKLMRCITAFMASTLKVQV